MRINYLTIILLLGFISCKKDDDNILEDEEVNFPGSVTFAYNGENVSYRVLKKDYHKDSNGDSLETPISKLWLGRNLGAERQATDKNDSLAAGDLFQWGRTTDGHQKRKSDTTQMLSNSHTPSHNKFISVPLSQEDKYDWLIDPDNSLWNGEKNTNNPCPDGWRVPTIDELKMEMHSWSAYNLNSAYSSELKWVSGGNRDNHGTERYSEYWAFVWSSTALDNGTSNMLAIIGSDTSEVISSYRTYGGSVRCIKDY